MLKGATFNGNGFSCICCIFWPAFGCRMPHAGWKMLFHVFSRKRTLGAKAEETNRQTDRQDWWHFWQCFNLGARLNRKTECSKQKFLPIFEKKLSFRVKTTLRFNDCFLSKTSLAKNLQMLFRGGGDFNPVTRPVFYKGKDVNCHFKPNFRFDFRVSTIPRSDCWWLWQRWCRQNPRWRLTFWRQIQKLFIATSFP